MLIYDDLTLYGFNFSLDLYWGKGMINQVEINLSNIFHSSSGCLSA